MRQRAILGATLALLTCAMLASCRGGRGPQVYVPARAGMESTFAGLSSRRVLDAAMHYPRASAEQVKELPMALTSSDGAGLSLVSLGGRAVVLGPLAFTELHLTFANPEDRVIEGRFTITLPPRAAISRFAMKLGEEWQEAEVVERQQAQQIYEDYLHRKQDPALLEKKAGNQFSARVFPIPARGVKELVLSYSQQLASRGEPYRLYLKGLPKIGSVDLSAMVGEQVTGKAQSSLGGEAVTSKLVRVQRKDFAPDRDFEVPVEAGPAGLRHGSLAVARVAPKLAGEKAALESLLVLVDTSASRAAGFYQQVEQLGAVLEGLKQHYGGSLPLQLACFDQVVDPVYRGQLGDLTRKDLDLILARRPLGASDLGRALAWVGETRGLRRVLLVTDGIATAGETDRPALHAAVRRLASRVQRLDVMLVGGIRDEGAMRDLVAGTLEQDGVLVDGDEPAARIAERLSKKTVSGITVKVPGARWVWPQRLDGVQPGDQVLVFAELAGQAPAALPVSLAGALPAGTQQVALVAASKPLLERAWVEARIAHLQSQRASAAVDPDLKDAIVKQIVGLSTKHRVLSDYTALLVLESDAEYARYGINRSALADVLVVGVSGLELQQRKAAPPPPVFIPRPPPRDLEGDVRKAPRTPSGPRPSEAMKASGAPSRSEEGLAMEAPAPAARPAPPRLSAPPPPPAPAEARPEPEARQARERSADDEAERSGPPPLSGKLAELAGLIARGQVEEALVQALRWRAEQPGDVVALLALGDALQANGNLVLAARVYGSVVDLFPSRADMLRFAGQRLEALGKAGLELALDAYQQAARQRPDHASGHHLLGLALARAGQLDRALTALEAGLTQQYRIERPGVRQVLGEDLGLVAAALLAKAPNRQGELAGRLQKHGVTLPQKASLRFLLTWETDANDVDFHVRDAQGGHASYRNKTLPTGGALYADVTNGYGPECFSIEGQPTAFPYRLSIHYYSRGPMGYGMGKVQIVQHDGKGGLRFEDRPFVVMNDRATVDLGAVKDSL